MVIQLKLGSKTTLEVSWVSKNIWRDWNQENGPETRPVSWSRISAAATIIQYIQSSMHIISVISIIEFLGAG